jgi:hypothetical protein
LEFTRKIIKKKDLEQLKKAGIKKLPVCHFSGIEYSEKGSI